MAASSASPGQAVKRLRLERKLTLAELGVRTGLPVSTLSKIENGKIALSYDKLARLSRALEIDIGLLFSRSASAAPQDGQNRPSGSAGHGRRSVARAGSGEAIETEIYSHLYPASDLLHKRFVPIIAEIKVRSIEDFGEMIRHDGEEYTYVIEGAVDLHTDQYAPLHLQAGDSVYFDSGMAHAYIAAADTLCRVLSICSGDETQLRAAFTSTSAASPAAGPGTPAPSRPPAVRRRKPAL